jgi:dienelactone hydrolase
MTMPGPITTALTETVAIPVGALRLTGDLTVPVGARGLVIFAHGSGSSRRSGRNRAVAARLNGSALATLLFDLLTEAEEIAEARTRHLRFDIGLLAERLTAVVDWSRTDGRTARLPIGLFGASTGAAAALRCAASRPGEVRAVVSRGGRPDLAGSEALAGVRAPTLLIIGGADTPVIEMNRAAAEQLEAPCRTEIIPGATHLFEEPGALETVARLASEWFGVHLPWPLEPRP